MIRATTKGYAVPYLVCHYDGTQYMWVAAGQVAGQITTWMNANAVDEIQVVTHSFGGVVLRWILSNPTYDSRYPEIIARIQRVNALAPPNRGSEAANLAGTLSGSWLTGWLVSLVGQNNDSTKNCTTSSMSYYNQYYLKGSAGRPALPKPYYNVAGTGSGTTSPTARTTASRRSRGSPGCRERTTEWSRSTAPREPGRTGS